MNPPLNPAPTPAPRSSLIWPQGPHRWCQWTDGSQSPKIHAGPPTALGHPVAACGRALGSPIGISATYGFNIATVRIWPAQPLTRPEFTLGPEPDEHITLLRCSDCAVKTGV